MAAAATDTLSSLYLGVGRCSNTYRNTGVIPGKWSADILNPEASGSLPGRRWNAGPPETPPDFEAMLEQRQQLQLLITELRANDDAAYHEAMRQPMLNRQ